MGQVGGAEARRGGEIKRPVKEGPLSVQQLIMAGPNLLHQAQAVLTCQPSGRERPGQGDTWPRRSGAGSDRRAGLGVQALQPHPHPGTQWPLHGLPAEVGGGLCCIRQLSVGRGGNGCP